ncbi:MAG TPA: flagellar hook-length control protein FliK [Pseudogracilibacillus sp.]|nr:flagellar hook-length control protein FliK [Pseudogracilibacillus sp.]
MNATYVQMFQPTQKQSFIKGHTMSNTSSFKDVMQQSFMLQQAPNTEQFNEENISKINQVLNDSNISLEDLKKMMIDLQDALSNEDSVLLDQILSNNQELLADLFECVLNEDEFLLNNLSKNTFVELIQVLQKVFINSEREIKESEGLSHLKIHQFLTQMQTVMDELDESASDFEIEDMIHEDVLELKEGTELEIVQLVMQLQSVMESINRGESEEKLARMLLPLLNEWTSISKQFSREALNDFATKLMNTEDLEVFKKVQELFEKRTHFQSKQMYSENASVTRSDIAQWIKAVVNQDVDNEQTHRVISTFNNETITAPRMSVLHQQARYHFQRLDSVQRIEAEMVTRIANTIQQHMSLQPRGPIQSLNMVLTPEHIGTLQVNFSQVNGEMIVRIVASSSYVRELLESNLHQLKHVFSPHQVQVVRDDDTLIEDDVLLQQEESQEDHQDNHDDQPQDEQNEEQITIDFTRLFEEALEEEEVMMND